MYSVKSSCDRYSTVYINTSCGGWHSKYITNELISIYRELERK